MFYIFYKNTQDCVNFMCINKQYCNIVLYSIGLQNTNAQKNVDVNAELANTKSFGSLSCPEPNVEDLSQMFAS